MRVKIFGAGSIGNHLSQASRRMGWDVVVVDTDQRALERMKNDIYPQRYGAWDPKIELYTSENEPKGGFDIIMVGTPPDTHIKLAIGAIEESPRLMHIEKPLCTPDLSGVEEFLQARRRRPATIVTVGYDYVVGEGNQYIAQMLKEKKFGEIITMDVEVREHWSGIFGAHFWLSGPEDTYLGFWRRGGGAGGEHSHALHLWQFFAYTLGWGRVMEVKAMFEFRMEGKAEYDRAASFLLKTESDNMGRVVQDVVTLPVKVWARIQGRKGFIEWHLKGAPEGDLVRYQIEGGEITDKVFQKKRPDDFYREVLHYQDLIDGKAVEVDSPLAFSRGLEVMQILNQSYPIAS